MSVTNNNSAKNTFSINAASIEYKASQAATSFDYLKFLLTTSKNQEHRQPYPLQETIMAIKNLIIAMPYSDLKKSNTPEILMHKSVIKFLQLLKTFLFWNFQNTEKPDAIAILYNTIRIYLTTEERTIAQEIIGYLAGFLALPENEAKITKKLKTTIKDFTAELTSLLKKLDSKIQLTTLTTDQDHFLNETFMRSLATINLTTILTEKETLLSILKDTLQQNTSIAKLIIEYFASQPTQIKNIVYRDKHYQKQFIVEIKKYLAYFNATLKQLILEYAGNETEKNEIMQFDLGQQRISILPVLSFGLEDPLLSDKNNHDFTTALRTFVTNLLNLMLKKPLCMPLDADQTISLFNFQLSMLKLTTQELKHQLTVYEKIVLAKQDREKHGEQIQAQLHSAKNIEHTPKELEAELRQLLKYPHFPDSFPETKISKHTNRIGELQKIATQSQQNFQIIGPLLLEAKQVILKANTCKTLTATLKLLGLKLEPDEIKVLKHTDQKFNQDVTATQKQEEMDNTAQTTVIYYSNRLLDAINIILKVFAEDDIKIILPEGNNNYRIHPAISEALKATILTPTVKSAYEESSQCFFGKKHRKMSYAVDVDNNEYFISSTNSPTNNGSGPTG